MTLSAAPASHEDIAHGIFQAGAVCARYRADPRLCALAHRKRSAGQRLSKQDLLHCVIWDEASEAAWQAVRRRVMQGAAGDLALNNFQEKQPC